LKYCIRSAKLCARAINDGSDYNNHLKPLLKELRFWEKVGRWFIYADNKDYDRLIRLMKISFIRKRAQRGKSIRSFFRFLRLF